MTPYATFIKSIRVWRREPLLLYVFARILARLDIGSYNFRLHVQAFDRIGYAYGVYQAACLAKQLGHDRVSVLELGVAGGDGLVALERLAKKAEEELKIQVDVYGFDMGSGLPTPQDYRDLPYHWQGGFYQMDEKALRQRLTRAKLVLGDVADTIKTFFDKYNPAPIGFVSVDLDYYSSTAAALTMFNASSNYLLPRIFCFFDDVVGATIELYNDYTGELAAIREFNLSHPDAKICPIKHLRMNHWADHMFAVHLFSHPQYNTFVSEIDQQLKLKR
jgi:hypothetical protein